MDQEEIHRKCCSDYSKERYEALKLLADNFENLPDKKMAWEDFHQLTEDPDKTVRVNSAIVFVNIFGKTPDINQAWNTFYKLLKDEKNYIVQFNATITLGYIFKNVPNKKQAWEHLHRLALEEDKNSRKITPDSLIYAAAHSIGFALPYVSNAEEAWNDLHKLTDDTDSAVRSGAAYSLGYSFFHIQNKNKASEDLHKLANDEESSVRAAAISSLRYAFADISNKKEAYSDLSRATYDEDKYIRRNAAWSFASIFQYIPDKQRASSDLYRLVTDIEPDVRTGVALSLYSAYSYTPDKNTVLNKLKELTEDEDIDVRVNANYSLGKICIFEASVSETEEVYRHELENAIKFLEIAAKKSTFFNPANFCFPFYRSFFSIIYSKNPQAQDEVDNYLLEMRNAIGKSKNRKILFETIENLANALKEVQNLEFDEKKEKLNCYRKYCDQASELINNLEETAPYATKLIRKGLPILDRKLKSLLEEIQEKANTACRESQGTDTEEIACAVSREVQKWEIGSQEYLEPQIESLVFMFKSYIPNIEENSLILNRVDQILHEQDIVKQYTLLNNLIPQIIDIQVSKRTIPILNEIKSLRASVDRLIESVDELQNPQEYLDTIQRNLEKIKNDIPEMKGKIDEVLYELYSPLSTTQKLKVAIPIIPLLATYEIETNVPKLVADSIYELKDLILRFKDR